MQSTWTRAHEAVTNTATTSHAAISAAAPAATTPASAAYHHRDARIGAGSSPVTAPGAAGEQARFQEAPR